MKQLLQNARWIGLALAALGIVKSSECTAGPLVLRGTATVATVYDDFVYEGTVRRLPFATHVGDTFTFFLSIESQSPSPGVASGSATFTSTIDGVQLLHHQLEVFVGNDIDVSLLLLAEPAIVDYSAIVGDVILIRHPLDFDATASAGMTGVSGAPSFRLNLGFLESFPKGLSEYPAILSENSIPQDPAIWESFSHRELAIRFGNLSFVGAYINTMTLIPEPSSVAICACCCFCGLGRIRPRRHGGFSGRVQPASKRSKHQRRLGDHGPRA